MNPILKNILAVIAGLIVGSMVNGVIIEYSNHFVAPPAGVDFTTIEGLKAGMHLFEPKHFIFPFLAHALGTFVGAYITARIATRKIAFAMVIGVFFLIGGIAMVLMVPSPIWFNIVDLAGAYLPVAYFAGKISK